MFDSIEFLLFFTVLSSAYDCTFNFILSTLFET